MAGNAKRQRIDGTLYRAIEKVEGVRELEGGELEVTFSLSSEIPVLRASFFDDPWIEVLGHNEGEVDLSRLNSGAPILYNHSRERADRIGVIDRAWLKDRKVYCQGRISGRPDTADIRYDLAHNVISGTSAGYQVKERMLIKENRDGPDEYRVVKWTILEGSIADIPIDATVGIGRAEGATHYRVVDLPEESGALVKGNTTMSEVIAQAPEAQQPAIPPPAVTTAAPESSSVRSDSAPPPPPPPAASASRSEPATVARPEPATPPPPHQPPPSPVAQPVSVAPAETIDRSAEVIELCTIAGFDLKQARAYISSAQTIAQIRADILNKRADACGPEINNRRIETVRDEAATRRAGMEEAILYRINPRANPIKGAGRDYVGMTLREMARACLEDQGIRTRGLSANELADMALNNNQGLWLQRSAGMHTTSDFPSVLLDVMNKSLTAAYARAQQTFRPIFREGSLADFRPAYRVKLGDMSNFEKVNEHGEFKYGSFGESKEPIQLATYGKIFAVTRQVIINDDLDMLGRMPQLFGNKAATLESDLAWGLITSNPVLSDGNALFSVAHGNLATGGGSALSATSLGVARAAMRAQRGPSATGEGDFLNITPRYLAVPAELETVALQLVTAITPAQTSQVVLDWIRNLVPIVEPRLSAASATAWYLFADPADVDGMEIAYLDGQRGLYTETRQGFEVDGTEMKARMDVGVSAIGHVGAYKAAGA